MSPSKHTLRVSLLTLVVATAPMLSLPAAAQQHSSLDRTAKKAPPPRVRTLAAGKAGAAGTAAAVISGGTARVRPK